MVSTLAHFDEPPCSLLAFVGLGLANFASSRAMRWLGVLVVMDFSLVVMFPNE
jgi:hypothetical protein